MLHLVYCILYGQDIVGLQSKDLRHIVGCAAVFTNPLRTGAEEATKINTSLELEGWTEY